MRGHCAPQETCPATRRGCVSGQRPANELQTLDIIVDDGRVPLYHAHDSIGDGFGP